MSAGPGRGLAGGEVCYRCEVCWPVALFETVRRKRLLARPFRHHKQRCPVAHEVLGLPAAIVTRRLLYDKSEGRVRNPSPA